MTQLIQAAPASAAIIPRERLLHLLALMTFVISSRLIWSRQSASPAVAICDVELSVAAVGYTSPNRNYFWAIHRGLAMESEPNQL